MNTKQQYLVKCEKEGVSRFFFFGPFDSLRRAEETVSKVCGGFNTVIILKSTATGYVSMVAEFLDAGYEDVRCFENQCDRCKQTQRPCPSFVRIEQICFDASFCIDDIICVDFEAK